MSPESVRRVPAPQIESQGSEVIDLGTMTPTKSGLKCKFCGHSLGRVGICGQQAKCVPGRDERHYHCLDRNCDENCGTTGTCDPIYDPEMEIHNV
jgi:hypothetical protein